MPQSRRVGADQVATRSGAAYLAPQQSSRQAGNGTSTAVDAYDWG